MSKVVFVQLLNVVPAVIEPFAIERVPENWATHRRSMDC